MLSFHQLLLFFLLPFSCKTNYTVMDQKENLGNCSHTTGMNWTNYHSYTAIHKYMECLANNYRHVMILTNIGNSYEGRPLMVARIGHSGRNATPVWLDGGTHGREWISPAAATYVLADLVINNEYYYSLLTNFTFYVMPMLNPDGYEYSRRTDRFWRKTRSRHNESLCTGVDANRNWGFRWGGAGGSEDPCHYQRYQGQEPFSEPETKAVSDFILSLDGVMLYISLHSYGQLILYPWPEDEETQELANITANVMGEEGEYVVKSVDAPGCSMEWARGVAGIKFAFSIELPPKRDNFTEDPYEGFKLPASEIEDVGEKVVGALMALVDGIIMFDYSP